MKKNHLCFGVIVVSLFLLLTVGYVCCRIDSHYSLVTMQRAISKSIVRNVEIQSEPEPGDVGYTLDMFGRGGLELINASSNGARFQNTQMPFLYVLKKYGFEITIPTNAVILDQVTSYFKFFAASKDEHKYGILEEDDFSLSASIYPKDQTTQEQFEGCKNKKEDITVVKSGDVIAQYGVFRKEKKSDTKITEPSSADLRLVTYDEYYYCAENSEYFYVLTLTTNQKAHSLRRRVFESIKIQAIIHST